MELTVDKAAQYSRLALSHIAREYPNKLDHVMAGPADVQGPRALHPVFFGSFDWHSCVHAYWLMARLLRAFPEHAAALEVTQAFDVVLTPANVLLECTYMRRPESRGFERPYGWAWLLKLAAELSRHDTAAGRQWCATLAPLARDVADKFMAYLPLADYPVRTGSHSNSAFAVTLALDYARDDEGLQALCLTAARRWYGEDRSCQAWEPSQDDFLSPALVEAVCMRVSLDGAAFDSWLGAFLPGIAQSTPATLFAPARVSDRSDGKIAHLDGLNLSRVWCWRILSAGWPSHDPRREPAGKAIAQHLEASLAHVAGDYMGEHWLATYAVMALLGPEA